MKAKYFIRLDDASQFMNYENWDPFFKLFDKYSIKPMIGVIPNNQDAHLVNITPDKFFWDKVKSWELKGYLIAMHGYDHVYCNSNSGLLNINPFSEFAGLELEQQIVKLKKAQNIFEQYSIFPKIFIAPAHSFDINTIIALKQSTTVQIISDGFAFRGFKKNNINWIPQQLWKPKSKYFGLWTICIHPETETHQYLNELEKFIIKNLNSFEKIENIKFYDLRIIDILYSQFVTITRDIKNKIKSIIK